MYWNVRFIHERYGLPIMITENGLAAHDTVSQDGKVHYPTQKRIIKDSAWEYKRIIETNGTCLKNSQVII